MGQCEFCLTETLSKNRFCSVSCSNSARADHSDETAMRRFWAKVDKKPGHGPNGDCWVWIGRVEGHGYGEMKISGKYKKAHRIALFGPSDLSNPLFACHRCDNPRCVRPDHLFAGTATDNVRDMHKKGRSSITGRPNKYRKLTPEAAAEVKSSSLSNARASKAYGVSRASIAGIRAGKIYKEI